MNLAKIFEQATALARQNDRVRTHLDFSALRKRLSLEAARDLDLDQVIETYTKHATNLHSTQFLGHQVSPPCEGSVIADLINAVWNNSTAVFDMGSSAIAVEREVIGWMLQKIGWDESYAGGVITSGGSLANLTGMVAARAAAVEDVWQKGNDPSLVAFVPETSHYCVARTLSIMGLGQQALHKVAVDERGIMVSEDLDRAIAHAIDCGKRPFAVAANGGATATGYYDPLDEIADICTKHKVWFHIDGAHGATALLSTKRKALMKGAERADSMVWDAHKMLRTSGLCAALLVKDKKRLAQCFAQNASYLDGDNQEESLHLYPFAVECTKPALALKLYMTLLTEGEAGLGAYFDRQSDLAYEAYRFFAEHEAFSAPFPPQSNIILFQKKGADQRALYQQVIRDGRFHITFAVVNGEPYLRLTIMNPNSKMADIEGLAGLILQISAS